MTYTGICKRVHRLDYYYRFFKAFHSNITVEEKLLKNDNKKRKALEINYIPDHSWLLGLILGRNLYSCQLKQATHIKSDKGALKKS